MLVVATVVTGLLAGVFASWSNAIMPGLSDVDDRTFVTAFRALDSAIMNPLFLGSFTVALFLIALAAFLHRGAAQRQALVWISVAFVAYLAVVVITMAVHEPLNVKLRDVAEPRSDAEFAAARALLKESMWATWNTVRAVAATLSFGCLTWALVLHRRVQG